ncbi:acyltransferase [Domibacillus indicus]|uniref:acyltransferase n=1 Tax=Domibacillus indicus TaxID=1437523 RepID=UPI00203B0611|nr:acyltransferase [Domibacillus indicus]MCM3788892.1 acyltransferase [Domibacillus indicus]
MIFRLIRKINKKILNKMYLYEIKKKYKTNNLINVYGRVQLDNHNIVFGKNVSLYSGVQIWGDGIVTIGDNVAIGKDTIIFAHKPMHIGNNTSIAGQCYIIDSDHGMKRSYLIREQELESQQIYIGEDVWIGAGSKVLKGSYISDGSIIGAMSLVKGFTEPYSVNVGIPIKKISERS